MKPHLPALAIAATSLVVTGCWANSAEIVSLTGKGESRPPQSTLWQEARIHQQIAPGHFVRTGDRSAMALLFEDKTQLRLSQNSMFQIKPADIAGGPTKVQLRQGRAWTQSKAGPNRLLMETPSAIAAIQGTDWILEVAPDGATQLIVLHGEVRLYNEHGSLTVRDKEAAHVAPGHAPTKLLLLNPADRVQWVRSYRVDSQRLVELNRHAPPSEHAKALSELLKNQQLAEAYGFARDWSTQPDAPALPFLLLADISVVNGLLDESQDWLLKGQNRHPKDVRFYAQRARLSLLRGDANEAKALIDEGTQRQPDALELQLANAELAIYEGHAAIARMAYESATTLAPTDARGWRPFTSLSESLDPRRAADLLNRYFTAMNQVIFDHGGTIDKFIGDSVMAFWNAPLEDPAHAMHATQAACAMQAAMASLNAELHANSLPELHMRIGVHTGTALVGNIGSAIGRLSYTAIGDTVNLASRLEGANKAYGTGILLSESTAQQLQGHVALRAVDRVRVKGRSHAVDIFTPCADAALARTSDAALEAFRHADRATCERHLKELEIQWPNDPLAIVYRARMEHWTQSPPAIDWDGSWTLDSK